MTGEHILIVEDDALVAEDIKAHLEKFGWYVIGIAPTGEEALKLLQGTKADLVIMDIILAGDEDGINTAEKISVLYQIPVIYLTSYTDHEKIERARATDPYGYLVKPFDERVLKTTVSIALSKSTNDRAIREGKRWARAILNSIEDGVITIDQAAHIRDMNPKAEELLSKSSSQNKDKLITDILKFDNPVLNKEFIQALHNTLQLQQHQDRVFSGIIHRHDQKRLHIDLNISRLSYEEGETGGIVITFRDVSLQQQAKKKLEDYNEELENMVNKRTEELTIAKERAESANTAKSQFLSNISHELITPLNPAIGYAQILMLDNNLSDAQKQYASEIYGSCNVLLNIITDLIELSRVETNTQIINYQILNPYDLAKNTIIAFREKANFKSIALNLRCNSDNIPTVYGDAKLISKVLHLLTDNAIKFTKQGEVTIELAVTAQTNDSVTIRFSVEDTGPGINQALIDSIFYTFNQADNSNTREHGGMGIGLTLSKRLVEYMGGEIGVDLIKPHGSKFWFELCFKNPD